MDVKMERLNQGEKVAAGSALALLVCMFLGWFGFGPFVSNAWDSLHYISPLLAIAIAAILTIISLKANGRGLDIPDGSVIFIIGCVAVLLILFRLIDPVSAGEASPFGGGGEGELGGSVEAGLFLGLVAAAGIAVGGYMATGGEALEQVKALLASRSGPVLPQAPPPPPPPSDVPRAAPPPVQPPRPADPSSAPLPPVTPPPPSATPPAPAAVAERTVFCEHCGARLRENDRFCGECGQATASQ